MKRISQIHGNRKSLLPENTHDEGDSKVTYIGRCMNIDAGQHGYRGGSDVAQLGYGYVLGGNGHAARRSIPGKGVQLCG